MLLLLLQVEESDLQELINLASLQQQCCCVVPSCCSNWSLLLQQQEQRKHLCVLLLLQHQHQLAARVLLLCCLDPLEVFVEAAHMVAEKTDNVQQVRQKTRTKYAVCVALSRCLGLYSSQPAAFVICASLRVVLGVSSSIYRSLLVLIRTSVFALCCLCCHRWNYCCPQQLNICQSPREIP